MKLNKITIRHFKGIAEMTVDVPANGVLIQGRNASGKTTIADAFFWAMTGRNYAGLTDGKGGFKVAPINTQLDTTVEIEFSDGTRFAKTLTAKGKLEYYVNGNEFQAREYDSYIAENIAADVALMCNPNRFANMPWQDQRGLISALAPVNMNELTQNTELVSEITTKDIETWRKSTKKAIETSKADIQKTNTEIATLTGQMPDLSIIPEVKNDIAIIDQKIKNLNQEINDITVSDTNGARLAQMRADIQEFVNNNKSAISDMESEKMDLERRLHRTFADYQNEIDRLNQDIKNNETQLVTLRSRFDDRARGMYPDNDGDVVRCPLNKEHCCADAVLTEIVNNNKRDIIAKWYQQKEADLNAIENEGKLLNAKTAELKEKLSETIARRDEFHKTQNAKIAEIAQKIETRRNNLNAEYTEKQNELHKLESDVRDSDSSGIIQHKRDEIASLNEARDTKILILANEKTAERLTADIEKKNTLLKTQIETLESLMAKFAEGENLIDAHAAETEKRVNDMFTQCQFQMFETLKNGTRQNACTITIGGVPYGRGANRAAEVNAAVEICNVFQKHFDLDLPIFVDNAESINNIVNPGNRQLVELHVNGNDLTITERI